MKQKYVLRFEKRNELRFISHHDLLRLFERAVRRAELPIVVHGTGRPRARISIPSPLSVGIEGWQEAAMIELTEWLPPLRIRDRLNAVLPLGIQVIMIQVVPSGRRPEILDVTYHVGWLREPPPLDLDAFLQRREYIVERQYPDRTRVVNVRDYVRELGWDHDRLRIHLSVTPDGVARPEEVLQGLGIASDDILGACLIARTAVHVVFRGSNFTRKDDS